MVQRTIPPDGMAQARAAIEEFFVRQPDRAGCREEFEDAFALLVECFRNDGTLFLCGNGGSFADCLHISGELMKTFMRRRPLPEAHRRALEQDPRGAALAGELQAGFRAVPLGLGGSLVSAIWNDCETPHIHYAQELYVMGRAGDALLAISTSGTARNVLNAMAVAKVLDMRTIALTGPAGGEMAEHADIALRLPGGDTAVVQEAHVPCYHLLCRAIEAAFFPGDEEQ